MCRLGFDESELAYLIIAQQPNERTLEQIIGRVIRRHSDKIGYILSFRGTHQYIQNLFRQQPITIPISADYLAGPDPDQIRPFTIGDEKMLALKIDPKWKKEEDIDKDLVLFQSYGWPASLTEDEFAFTGGISKKHIMYLFEPFNSVFNFDHMDLDTDSSAQDKEPEDLMKWDIKKKPN